MNSITLEYPEVTTLLEKTIKEYVAVEKTGIAFTKAKNKLVPTITDHFNKSLSYHYTGNYLSDIITLFASMLGNNNNSDCFYNYVNTLIIKYNFEIDTLEVSNENIVNSKA